MFINDKNKLRAFYKSVRNSVDSSQKNESDRRILTWLINFDIYLNSAFILIYVSFGSEVDTKALIEYSLGFGKRLAVPHCENNEMNFYEISSLNELVIGKFGIPTVTTGNNLPVDCFDGALCVVPGLCFDLYGNRIGYGGGFYDRFLEKHHIPTVGLTYEKCICNQIPYEEYDIKIDVIITENYFRNSEKGGSTYE